MTKRNLLLVSLFLVLGIVAMAPSALAQTTWTVPAPVALTSGRAEGKAEATGPVIIKLATAGLTPGTGTTGVVSASSSFTLTYNAAVGPVGTVYYYCGASPANGYTGTTSPWASGCSNLSVPTVAGKTATIKFTANTTFTNGDGSYLGVISRVDATGITPLPGQVTAAVSAAKPSSGYAISVSPTTAQEVLAVNPKPSLTLAYDAYKDALIDKGTPASVLSCIGTKDVATYDNQFIVNVAESFPYALTTSAQEMAWDPGSGVSSESGYKVTNGTNLVVTFSNVPALIGITAEDIEPCSTLQTADPLYCPGGTLGLNAPATTTVSKPTSGQISFTYTISSVDVGYAENVDLSYVISSSGSPLPPGLPPMTVNLALGPTVSTTTTANIPYFTGAAEETTPLAVVNFSDCVTNLLFPYVNTFVIGGTYAFANFGTGIDFANTTTDPFGAFTATAAGSAVQQSGSCTVYFYPANLSSAPVYTTPTIPSGASWAFDVGSSVPAFYGNTGYAIAICNFQNAYGFAEIYDNYGIGSPTATLSYEAYILPAPQFYHRTPAGDALGESAIAPVNLVHMLQKLVKPASSY
jgi:hypothetical protein